VVVQRRPLAADDIAEIWDHIADDSLRAAARWIDQLDKQFELLATQPPMRRQLAIDRCRFDARFSARRRPSARTAVFSPPR
jgi:plasmid stabilization system protein ParE